MTRSDVQLMLDVKAGDEQSFELLLQRYRRPLVNFLFRMVRARGRGGRFGAGSIFKSVSRTEGLRAERQVHDVAFPDRDKSGPEFGAGQPASTDGNFPGRAGDGGCGRR